MAQVIAPEIWQEGIDDNRLLPGRYTTGLFTGSGVKIANNGEACRVWDIQVTDYITDYDDRRLNGLAGTNADGHDGWGASSYGVFQDVRFDSRVYTMGRHRSIAMRLFDEMQYGGPIGHFGGEKHSPVRTNGQNLMKTAQLINKAKEIWEKQILGPDIDCYNLFAIMNGHISGRWVADDPDHVMIPDARTGHWVAQPGMIEGQAIQPRFAPIHCIEWEGTQIAKMLQNIKVSWNNMFLPQENRCIILDAYYEYELLTALTGTVAPATEAAYSDMQNGSFTRLMGWDFNFEIPSQYFPVLYTDANLNVVHSETGTAADAFIRSVPKTSKNESLFIQLAEANRMIQPNYVRTEFDKEHGVFIKTLTNYPLGQPVSDGLYGMKSSVVAVDTYAELTGVDPVVDTAYGMTDNESDVPNGDTYPFSKPGSGYGMKLAESVTGPDFGSGPGKGGTASAKRVVGCAIYKPAAQLSQEYSEMVTDEGRTRGKFTEMCMDVKYDAWVIESLSHGIMPIVVDAE